MSGEPGIPRITTGPARRWRRRRARPSVGGPEIEEIRRDMAGTSPLRVALFLALVFSLAVAAFSAAALPGQIRAASAKDTGTAPRVATATVGTVSRKLVLDGLVIRQEDQQVRVPANGTVTSIAVQQGDAITAGTNLAVLTLPAPGSPAPSPSPSPTPTPSPTGSATPTPSPTPSPSPSPTFTFAPPPAAPEVRQIAAPIDGVVKDISVVLGQFVRSGRVVMVLAPTEFDVIAPVAPSLLYQFFAPPIAISGSIEHGPAEFDCTFESIGDNLTVTEASSLLTQDVDLRCSVPTSVDVFPGVRVRLEATTAEATSAIVLPVRVIQAHGTEGFVWVVEKGHRPARRTVQLGISDGRITQILSGLQSGDRVLDPAPTGGG